MSAVGSKNLINKSVEQIRRELESNTLAKDKKSLSMDELLQQSINDDTSDEEDSDDELSSEKKTTPSKTASVEDLLDGYDEKAHKAAKSPVQEDTVVAVEPSAEELISKEKVPVQLSQRQRDLLSKQDIPELSKLLESVDIEPLSEEEDLKDSCWNIMKKLSKAEQKRALYSVTGTPVVEAVKPEEDFFEVIHKLDVQKLRKLDSVLVDVSILGRVSTAQERQLMVEKYNPSEKTKLERVREEFLANATRTSYDDCVTQADFESVYQSR